ncbi:VOC family protein [Urechidicola croceus]|uniref:Glyoxalase/fosfomycin resistance/dioxygenase domain-containing protein n=1 Tax=Urechidicola croceus TaxID=1850246 RepID=A0A1D8P8R6_9FLAO|nr:VOC family protein [Urechidicola croceus]AOW20966.1 hypothetical protein LPB138_09890 [Urechidicola croceus]
MDLGTFSISINVKDLNLSLIFYQKLGFKIIDGGHLNDSFPDSEKIKWRILETKTLKIGLFQGMFNENIFTFHNKDVLTIQDKLKSNGVIFRKEVDSKSTYKSAMLIDPDGNKIMLDQI